MTEWPEYLGVAITVTIIALVMWGFIAFINVVGKNQREDECVKQAWRAAQVSDAEIGRKVYAACKEAAK